MNKWFSDLQLDIKKVWTEPIVKGPPSLPVSCLCKGNKFLFLCFYPPSSPPSFSVCFILFFTQHNVIIFPCCWKLSKHPTHRPPPVGVKTSDSGESRPPAGCAPAHCCLISKKAILQIFRHKLMLTNSRASWNDTSSLWSRSCHGQRSHQKFTGADLSRWELQVNMCAFKEILLLICFARTTKFYTFVTN